MRILLFCLLVDLTKRARRRALIAQAWVELLAQADHCHTSGAFRGRLCRPCNTGLAYVEKPGFVELAREYLGRK